MDLNNLAVAVDLCRVADEQHSVDEIGRAAGGMSRYGEHANGGLPDGHRLAVAQAARDLARPARHVQHASVDKSRELTSFYYTNS